MPGPPLVPIEQVELDALLDRKAVREGKQRAEIDEELKLRRAQECRAERETGCVIGLLLIGIADLVPLVALLVLRPDVGGQFVGLIIAATLISTPLVWLGASLALDRLYSMLRRTEPEPMGLALVIAWVWAGLFSYATSRLLL